MSGAALAILLGLAWWRGDLHVHTSHSFDGHDTVAQVRAMARYQRLDFICVSDHDTQAVADDPAAQGDEAPVVIVGMETAAPAGGHLGRIGRDEKTCALVVNHPAHGRFPWVGPLPKAHAVEVWNGFWTVSDTGLRSFAPGRGSGNDQAVAFWEERLGQGERLAAVGGSDRHMFLLPGHPTTWVLAESPREPDIVAAVRAGRTVVTEGPSGPLATLEADADDDGRFEACVGGSVTVGRRAALRVRVTRATGGRLRIFRRTRILRDVAIASADFSYSLAVTPRQGDWYRAEVLVPPRLRGFRIARAPGLEGGRPVLDVGDGLRLLFGLAPGHAPYARGALTSAIFADGPQ